MAANAIHKREKEQFIKLFKQDRIARFNDRLAVLEVFLKTEHHVTFRELAGRVRDRGFKLSEAFVLDTIELMCQYGFARKNLFDTGEPRYEHRHLGQHHDHMICTKCKGIFEFENPGLEQMQLKIAAEHGFHLLQHKMELYGVCRQCLDRRDILIPLEAARPGERVKVKSFTGGARSRMRLLTMGLRVGDEVEVIANVTQGQMVVAVEFRRLMLGRGLAAKIQVMPCD